MKKIVKRIIFGLLPAMNWLPLRNAFHLRGTKIISTGAIMKKCKFNCYGNNNIIKINNAILNHCTFFINGDNNYIEIGCDSSATLCEFHIEDNQNEISIGSHTRICGKTHLACIEGTKIKIGNECLFSSEIVFRTGDSHSVLDLSDKRINPSKNILVGDHVWIGHRSILQKGTEIAENSIVATGSILTKVFRTPNIAIGGVPAKSIKENINWSYDRISLDEE